MEFLECCNNSVRFDYSVIYIIVTIYTRQGIFLLAEVFKNLNLYFLCFSEYICIYMYIQVC